MDRTLPNGVIVRNVNPAISEQDFKEQAIAAGYVTSEDYDRDMKTNADMVSTIAEAGGGVAGALYGASVGSALGPVGTAVGGLIGGAFGAMAGSATGEVAEAQLEDRSISENIFQEAGKAGVTDAAYGLGFGVLGKGLSVIVKPVYNLVTKNAAKETIEAITSRAAMEVKTGKMTAQEAAAKHGVTEEMVDQFESQLLKSEDELLKVELLQEKLTAQGTTLLPSQTGVAGTKALAAQDLAQASLTMSKVVDDAVEGQNQYILKEFNSFLNSSKRLTRDETGVALQNLVKDTEAALKETVSPLYREIDKAGKIHIRRAPTLLKLNKLKKSLRPSSALNTAESIVKALDTTASPKMVTKTIGDLKRFKNGLGNLDVGAKKYTEEAIASLQGTLKGKQFVDTSAIAKLGEKNLDRLINKYGVSSIEGKFATRAKKLTEMRSKMSFSEAHEELSNLKALQRDMKADLGSSDSQANALMVKAIKTLEDSMGQAAKNFNPELKASYEAASKIYAEGIKVINGDWIVRSLNKKNPAQIGEDLVSAGEQIGVESVRKLIAKAKELKSNSQGENILESMKDSYLQSLFPTRSAREAEQFAKKMLQPKFRDTFNAIVDPATGNKLKQLAEEVSLMQRGLAGAESAASLTVRGREIGTATSPTVTKAGVYLIVSNAVKKQMEPKEINKIIAGAKMVNSALAKGVNPDSSLVKKFLDSAFLPSASAGIVAGAILGE